MSWKDKVRPFVRIATPATRVAERVAGIAIHLQKPTILGVGGMISAGLNALNEVVNEQPPCGYGVEAMVPSGYLLDGFKNVGARLVPLKNQGNDTNKHTSVEIPGYMFTVDSQSTMYMSKAPDEAFYEWVKQALDTSLPPAIEIRRAEQDGTRVMNSVKLARYSTKQGAAIIEQTLPLLDGGRCILLEGKPGVGKTTMAQEIARSSALGRTVMLQATVIGSPKDDRFSSYSNVAKAPTALNYHGGLFESSRMLNPGTVIIDDIDKVHLALPVLEALRKAAKLVILTANNGKYDEVLDGSLMRAGRVDEVFTIKPEHTERHEPFHALTEEQWEEVREWPVAYLNEVEKRILNRPHDLRLEDLRERVGHRTRSGDKLY